MSEKTKVTMIQDADGQTRKVRIGGVVIPVQYAGPQPGQGCMNFSMTIEDVEVAFEAVAAVETTGS